MFSERHFSVYAGSILLGLILVLGGILALESGFGATTGTNQLTVGTSSPSVTGVTLNNGSAITLLPNATTTIYVNFTVGDNQGCSHVFTNGNVSTTVYRTGVAATCGIANPSVGNWSTLNCYVVSTTTHNCTAGNTIVRATATVDVYYFAQATDGSSSFSAEGWQAYVTARDGSSTTGVGTSTEVELNTLVAIDVPSGALNYGSLAVGANTSSTNQSSTIKNAGNASMTLQLSGSALRNTGTGATLATSSQHYATGTFTFGGTEQALSSTAQAVAGFLVSRPPLANWSNTTALPTNFNSGPAAVHDIYVYVIGGLHAGSQSTTVRFAPINAAGSIGSWTDTTPLPGQNSDQGGGAFNGYIYSIGGWSGTSSVATAYFAPINATGSIGSWTETTPLPAAYSGFASFIHNGYIYVLGGGGSNIQFTSTVRFAPINATGSIGSWTETTPLPASTSQFSAVVDRGIVYEFGGYSQDASVNTATVRFAPILSNDTLGAWSQTAPLPSKSSEFPAVVNNGIVYALGGATSNTSTVRFTPLASRNTYWGVEVPTGSGAGTYSSTVTYTAVFSP